MKKLPIGIQTFENVITGNYLYIDKTVHIHRLIDAGKYYFLSRPRRFGKSLLLSTMKAVLEGKKELFDGLWIADKWDWETTYPVIHISFSSIGYRELGLEQAIDILLNDIAAKHQIKLKKVGISSKFKELIETLSQKNKVAILIDEYDKPLIDYLDKENLHQAKAHQKVLKSFYSVLKDSDPYLKFLFITGVSKFGRVGVFSDLNNLYDISLLAKYSTICGYTQSDVETKFEAYFPSAMETNEMDRTLLLDKLKEWYNGYTWDGLTRMYNPFSILSFFGSGEFKNYWFITGTPTFLINILKERSIYDIDGLVVGASGFESYDIEKLETIPLLFQTGYLTIKKRMRQVYELGYPNKEVEESMMEYLVGAFRHEEPGKSAAVVHFLENAFIANDLAIVITHINQLFATIPYHLFEAAKESYYHALTHLLFTYLGVYIQSEINSSKGRCDAVVQTDTHIYILEFKLDHSAKMALEQIKEKAYADQFMHSSKSIVAVGINFDSKIKEVGEWEYLVIK